jgi:hypothetical protein
MFDATTCMHCQQEYHNRLWDYSKHAEVTVPSLDDWEKEWEKISQRNMQPKLLPVDFRSSLAAIAQSN